ncbi:Autophagy-related [Macleaya cordata]|uniref:Autophagy-related protein 2 n=1 Tax=Macleaya cordata TaxID=56857 RepID=A0A200QZ96_MACCD|nr:Autophagy-related [Macleaya cordata]
MFPWYIAKSAEAMFPRWAIKHVCKFLFKKKLGKFIIGDLDLDQLDVQFGAGTIQLSDLALNVDYINQKLGATPFIVKEGSIGSLLVKFPWKFRSCQIEVEELELILAPRVGVGVQAAAETCNSTPDCKQSVRNSSEKLEHEMRNNVAESISLDVHEGVKTIAKMVKWLLTSFHVKVKKLIVAYDPCSENDKRRSGSHRALVLRITETEYGTCVSEDANANSDAGVDSILGISRLTNFVKFEGAVVELLHMDDIDNQTHLPCASGTTFSEWYMGRSPSDASTPILTGEGGGFSGNMKLSIPWKNGTLDIQKLDADISIDPMKLRLQPSTIMWIICLWQSLNNLDKDDVVLTNYKGTDSVYHNSASQFHPSTLSSTVTATDQVMPRSESFPTDFFSLTSHETAIDALLQGSHVIQDWVPLSTNKNQNDRAEAGPDFGASIDQFFECFDGLRTSQSALGSSGMWNWTCSVFSAITAASSLASGSLNVPSEQQSVKTNLKATVAGVSVVLSLYDEDQRYSGDKVGNLDSVGRNVHYLSAKCRDLLLNLQICSREMKFEATVKHIELDDHFCYGNDAGDFDLSCENSMQSQGLSIQHLQAEIEGALPPFTLSQDPDSEKTTNVRGVSHGTIPKDDLVKMKLLRTSSVSHCQFTMTSTYVDGSLVSSTSFSLKLPPFIFWVNFNLINMLLDLLKQVGNSFETKNNKDSGLEVLNEMLDSSCHGEGERSPHPGIKTLSTKGSLQGNIILPNARFILCFPLHKGDVSRYSSWDQFIGLDISQPLSKEKVPDAYRIDANVQRGYTCKSSSSIHLNIGNLNIYLISTSHKDAIRCNSSVPFDRTYSAQEILTVASRRNCLSGISMIWQDGPVTGPWIANRARCLATSQDFRRSGNKERGKGSEFASVTTVGDLDDINSRIRQEIIFSSSVFLHIHLSTVLVKLGSLQYQLLNQLLNQVVDGLSCVASSNTTPSDSIKKEVASVSQLSVLVESDSLEILVNLDQVEDIKLSIQKELSGSWKNAKLQIQKFELLSVSNIGGISGSGFTWLGHGEGELWGSIDGVPGQELLLISCSNSTMRRGDGEGANALSIGSAGTAIFHLQEPHIFHSFTSVTVRCSTIVAPGGRVDWLNAICNFFSLPSCENELGKANSSQEGYSEGSAAYGASFVLNLVDVGLVYEPHINNLVVSGRVSESKSNTSTSFSEEPGEQYVGCLLAAASLNLSNQALASSLENDYKIRVQDLGLLLCAVSAPRNSTRMYDVEYLRKAGYVKVAGEALVEAVLRTDCKNGLLWELECSDSHINLDTCHDTTSGLIRLAAQLQQLFAPDMEESVVHLQTRWNTVQQALNRHVITSETKDFTGGSASSSYTHPLSQDAVCSERYGVVGLMDEICEDAFHLHGNGTSPSDPCDLEYQNLLDGGLPGEMCEFFSQNVSVNGSMPATGLESAQTSSLQKDCFPELIEGYYIAGLCPLPELSARNHSLNIDLNHLSRNEGHGKVGPGNSGWYQDTSLRIVEDHIPKVSDNRGREPFLGVDELSSISCGSPDEFCNARGRLVLKKIDVRWRMYAGSDWHGSKKEVQLTAKTGGRDTTVCLELTLSGLDLQYDMFPDGDICVSKLSLSVQDFNLYDRSRDAPWKLVLGYYHSKDHPRESSAKAFKLDLEAVRPDPLTPLEEYRLRLAFLPMLLHLDQDQLDFLISFFGNKGSSVDQLQSLPHDLHGSRTLPMDNNDFEGNMVAEEALLPYFQKFDIWPVVFRVDYNPRRVDLAALRGGNYVHLVNLVPWKGIELQLKHVHAVGVYGWSSVCETIVGEWLEDISHNQVHKFLKGLPPIRSLFTVGSGAAKLVSLPVKNYKKDHRLLTGIQRGAIAFLRSISLEAVGLGVHLAAGAHDILLQTEYILTSIPPSVPSSVRNKTKTNVRSNQPKDAQQGIQQAYESLSDGLGKTASALVGTPLKTYQRGGGAGSALASAVCAAPAAAIAPASAAMRAVHCALLGFRNSLDPEHKKESLEKYLGPNQPKGNS